MQVVDREGAVGAIESDRLETLFDLHYRRLYLLARRLSRDPEESRDLVQDAFLRAARSPRSVPSDTTQAEAWLVRVLVNLCRDRHRRQRVRDRAPDDRMPTPLPSPDPESSAVARATVQAALARLTPRRRAVVVLHELEGHPTRRVAQVLGMKQVTVRWHLSAAKKSLAELLEAGEVAEGGRE